MTPGAEDRVGSDSDDRALLAAHVAGDPDAFGLLVARHRDRLWAVALRTTGHREDAADGLQDGLVAACRRATSYRGDAAVTTWLHRVVVNACLDRLRAARVRRAESLPDGDDADRLRVVDGAEGSGLAGPRRDGDPEASAVRADERRRVLEALAHLPLEQRASLVLVDIEGHSVAEAAEILDCAPGTVKSRCSRGRTRLAELLADLVADDTRPPGNPSPRSAVPPGRVRRTDRPPEGPDSQGPDRPAEESTS